MKQLILDIIKQSGSHHVQLKFKTYHKDKLSELVRLTSFLPSDTKLTERLYCVVNDITERKLCLNKNCNNPVKFPRGFSKGYLTYCCIQCNNSCDVYKSKKEKTMLDKYGVKYPYQSKQFLDKCKQTNLDRYGVENAFQSEIKKDKIKQTNLEKYGYTSAVKNEKVKKKQEKTMLDKYGVDNYFKARGINGELLVHNDFEDKYGVRHALQIDEFMFKLKQTNIVRHGTEFPQRLPSIKEKAMNNYVEKYGILKYKVVPRVGLNEDTILNYVSELKDIKIFRQFRVGKFFVDGYDIINNTVYEVYESYHYSTKKQKAKDKLRQSFIENTLHCKFIIITDTSKTKLEQSDLVKLFGVRMK